MSFGIKPHSNPPRNHCVTSGKFPTSLGLSFLNCKIRGWTKCHQDPFSSNSVILWIAGLKISGVNMRDPQPLEASSTFRFATPTNASFLRPHFLFWLMTCQNSVWFLLWGVVENAAVSSSRTLSLSPALETCSSILRDERVSLSPLHSILNQNPKQNFWRVSQTARLMLH